MPSLPSSTPVSELDESPPSLADERPGTSMAALTDPEKSSNPPEHGGLGQEKALSAKSLSQALGSEKRNSADTEHSSDVQYLSTSGTISEVHDGIEVQRDVELGDPVGRETGVSSLRDPNLVTWDGPDDPKNPKAWAFRKKWAAVIVGKQNKYVLNGVERSSLAYTYRGQRPNR